MKKTHLTDLGIDTEWDKPMELLISEINDPTNDVTLFGKISFSYILEQAIVNRLLALELLRKRPEIASIPIRPIFIVGMFRTGTTLLYNCNLSVLYVFSLFSQ
jgi:hypothetical protein